RNPFSFFHCLLDRRHIKGPAALLFFCIRSSLGVRQNAWPRFLRRENGSAASFSLHKTTPSAETRGKVEAPKEKYP
ncbi:MAG: hypothetical protein LUC35_05795, partial [Clostridiales bacterium]|nr:hypothetical protein [Clostridiales bacterium]